MNQNSIPPEATPHEPNYAAWRASIPTPNTFRTLPIRKQLLTLCHLATLAPSTHNTQPWAFHVNEEKNAIVVYLDRLYVLPASDPQGRQATISVGCAIEHILVAASYFGYGYDFLPTAPINLNDCTPLRNQKLKRYTLLAHLQFSDKKHTAATPQTLLTSMFSRRVRRAEFDPQQKIPAEMVRRLEAVCKPTQIKMHTVTDPIRRFSLAEFQGQADGYVINSPSFARELGDWLLPNTSNSTRGMPGNGFGLNDQEASRLHDALRGVNPLRPEDGLTFSLGGKLGIEKSPLIGALTAVDDNPTSWLEAGRVLERMFLILEEGGYAVAVHAGVVEVPLVNRMFATLLGTRRKIMALFRCGKARNPQHAFRPHSPRVPVEDLLIKKFI